jgi:hypothetical protein
MKKLLVLLFILSFIVTVLNCSKSSTSCHFIGITAPAKIIDDLVKKGLVEIPDYMEEENEKQEDEVLN